jgi:hypothetical protein
LKAYGKKTLAILKKPSRDKLSIEKNNSYYIRLFYQKRDELAAVQPVMISGYFIGCCGKKVGSLIDYFDRPKQRIY